MPTSPASLPRQPRVDSHDHRHAVALGIGQPQQLNPVEDARAVQAMHDEGYTFDGAAQALGCSRQLVTARVKILELPEAGRQLVGAGEIPVSAIDNLLAIGDVAPPLVQAVVDTIAAGKGRAARSGVVELPGDGRSRCADDRGERAAAGAR